MRAQILLPFAFASLSLVACGDDGDGDGAIDARGIDAVQQIDAPPVTCSVSTNSFGDRPQLAGNSQYTATMTAGVGDIRAIIPLEAADPRDIMIVEFYTGYAPFGTPQMPTPVVAGTYQLTGAQANYATCGVCVRIGTNLAGNAYEHDYMVTGGTLTVTQVDNRAGGMLAFNVSNLTFTHVTIDEETFESTPVGDGCDTAITSGAHTSTMMAPQQKAGAAAAAAVGKTLRF